MLQIISQWRPTAYGQLYEFCPNYSILLANTLDFISGTFHQDPNSEVSSVIFLYS